MESKNKWIKSSVYMVGVVVALFVGVGTMQFIAGQKLVSSKSANADEIVLHWPHSYLPLPLRMVNYSTTRLWPDQMNRVIADWQKSGVVSITQKEAGSDICELIYGQIGFCSFSQPNSGLISWSQRGAQADGHILFGQINFNDAYLATHPTYGVPAWRNYIACYSLGFTLGLDQQLAPPEGGDSCMQNTNFINVVNQQHPSNASLTRLKAAYDHIDSAKAVPATLGTSMRSGVVAPNSWGSLVASSGDGAIEYYRADLGNGTTLYTTAFRDLAYKK